jgi:hypothetical protein
MTHFFISYDGSDSQYALQLKNVLEKAGKKGWMDKSDIVLGAEYREEIEKAIRRSKALVLLLTANSASSHFVTYEWGFAMGAGVRVIPVMISQTKMPLRLESVQCLNLSRPGDIEWSELIERIKALKDQKTKSSSETSVVPSIFARFELRDGEPVRIGREYRMWLGVKDAPLNTKRVHYEILDEANDISDPKWSVSSDKVLFQDWISLYGDVFVTARGKSAKEPWRAQAMLSEALKRFHRGKRLTLPVRLAIANIEAN